MRRRFFVAARNGCGKSDDNQDDQQRNPQPPAPSVAHRHLFISRHRRCSGSLVARPIEVAITEAAPRQPDRCTRPRLADHDMRTTDADRCRYSALAEVERNVGKDLDGAAETDAHVKWSRAGDACSDCLSADSRSDRLCGMSHGRRCNGRLDSDSVYGLTAHATVPKHASHPSNGDHRPIAHR